MSKNYYIKSAVLASLFAVTGAQAAGFALIEQSASGMGNAYAGGSAAAEDASTIFFNPAGMTYINGTQAVGALHLINPNAEFNNKGSVAANRNFAKTLFRPLGGEGPNAGDLAFVPNFYFMTEITPSIKAGVGINAPFGLKTEYDDKWIGRFQADKSEVKTININPSVAFKVNDQLSLGFGVSAMRAEATLTQAVNFGPFGEGSAKIKGDDWDCCHDGHSSLPVRSATELRLCERHQDISSPMILSGAFGSRRAAVPSPTRDAPARRY